jgi:microcompartment protein CcmK/EutM
MNLGRVVGTVIATKKNEKLVGSKLLIVKSMDLEGNVVDPFIVAVDTVGAGVGEVVLVVTGSSARATVDTQGKSVDAVVMAIVDYIEVDRSLFENVKEGKVKAV